MKTKIGIIIPAYNEENRIIPTLEAYGKKFTEVSKMYLDTEFEILISINATTDNTKQLVIESSKKYPIITYIDHPEGGKGLAIRRGFEYFLKQPNIRSIGYVDADMSTSADEMFRLIMSHDVFNDNIIANRYDKYSKLDPAPGFKRKLASRVFNKIVRCLFWNINVRDSQCGAKIFLAEDIRKITPLLTIKHWATDVEILFLLAKNDCRIIEVPTFWVNRDYSKIQLGRSSINMLLSIIRLRIVNSPFKWIMKLYDNLPNKYKIHNFI